MSSKNPLIAQPPIINENLSVTEHTSSLIGFDTDNIIVITWKNFHDKWYKILKALQAEVTTYGSLAPLQPNNIFLCCEDLVQAKILESYKGWLEVGPFQLLFSSWSQVEHYTNLFVPSQGVWIEVWAFLLINGIWKPLTTLEMLAEVYWKWQRNPLQDGFNGN